MTMTEKVGEWQVVERRTHDRASPVWAFFARLLFQTPVADGVTPSPVTWTVRNEQTGETRKITAGSEKEFSERLASRAFD
jgi:hypothetical protein